MGLGDVPRIYGLPTGNSGSEIRKSGSQGRSSDLRFTNADLFDTRYTLSKEHTLTVADIVH